MRILIVEDEENIADYLIDLLKQHPSDFVVLGCAQNLAEAKVLIHSTKPDLVFFDINLPDGNAFSLLESLQPVSFKLIFVTAYDTYAIKAIKMGALDYILKPFNKEELYEAIDKTLGADSSAQQLELATKAQQQAPIDRIAIKQQNTISIVKFEDLIYCKSDGPYTHFFLENMEKVLASSTLKEFETLLPDYFIRTHKSYVVNAKKIKTFDKVNSVLVLQNGQEVAVSSRKKNEVMQYMLR